MQSISQERCLLHEDREAAARCPECQRYFCRECITEHEGRVICSRCLEIILNQSRSEKEGGGLIKRVYQRTKSGALTALQVLIALLIIWGSFHYFGKVMAEIPSDFHDGTIWKDLKEDLE
ncbi:rhomboid family protein [Desulfatibacillum aliphaticivorans]|uniref:Rhomboid family protein n=1 Tax=Desulfatibacillum aliphaticivorans TaxID=218208 RepID=B8FIA6_DESAL|nr:rhomboid family protein [Desulfatibacillum aliphaticivorans]ACL02673.1 rhomboid family protein [Desulfatibacillum aliphaticivorans]